MPTSPDVILTASIDAGAPSSTAGVTVALGSTVQLSGANKSTWTGGVAVRWEIRDYPADLATPAGWTEDGDTGALYVLGVADPPTFDVDPWGKYACRVIVRGSITSQIIISVLSPSGLEDTARGEGSEFGGPGKQHLAAMQANLRVIEAGVGSGGSGLTPIADQRGLLNVSGGSAVPTAATAATFRTFLDVSTTAATATAISTAVATEASTRAAADTTEAITRAAADTALDTRLDAIEYDGPTGAATDGVTAPAAISGASGTYATDTSVVTSTVDTAASITIEITWDTGLATAGSLTPLLVFLGYHNATSALVTAERQRLAALGYLVIVVPYRTGGGSDGGRDNYDAIDVLASVRTEHAAKLSSTTRAAAIGYSFGGYRTLATFTHCPDLCVAYSALFPVVDVGYGSTAAESFWVLRDTLRSNIEAAVGVAPSDEDGRRYYRARNLVELLPYSLGLFRDSATTAPQIRLFFDEDDTDVPDPTRLVTAAHDVAGLKRISIETSDSGDALRWEHGYPDAIVDLREAAWRLAAKGRTYSRPAIPGVWTKPFRVGGWVRFDALDLEFWTCDPVQSFGVYGEPDDVREEADAGTNHVIEVQWDVQSRVFRGRSLTGPCWMQVRFGGTTRTVLLGQTEGVEAQTLLEDKSWFEVEFSVIEPEELATLSAIEDCVCEVHADTGVTGTAPVTAWTDQSGTGNTFNTSSGGAGPSLETDGGDSLSYVHFDATNTELISRANAMVDVDGDFTLVFYMRKATAGGNTFWAQSTASAPHPRSSFSLISTSGPGINAYHRNEAGTEVAAAGNPTYPVNAFFTFVVRRDGTSLKMQVNNGTETVDAVGFAASPTLDARTALGAFWAAEGVVSASTVDFRTFACWSRALTDDEIADVKAFITDRWTP